MLGRNTSSRKGPLHGSPRGARIREAVFQILYGPGARWYDQFTDWLFLGEWERWQRLALDNVPRLGTVVELGGGTGRLAALGATPERRWIVVDSSPTMLALAARRRQSGGACLLRAAAQALPLADGCCDAIVATFPSNYILSPATQAEIRRIIVPGGSIVVVLSGELLPATPRRWARHVALTLFYGRPSPASWPVVGMEGFDGTVEQMRTDFGSATVLRATRLRGEPV